MDGLETGIKGVRKGLKIGANLLKNTLKEVTEAASGVPSPSPGPSSRPVSSSASNPELQNGPTLVHYHLQGDDKRCNDTDNCFIISEKERQCGLTKGLVRKLFPVKGNFVLRFKTFDATFGFIWTDLHNDAEAVPIYLGQVEVKVFRLPDNANARKSVGTARKMPSFGDLVGSDKKIPAQATPSVQRPAPVQSPTKTNHSPAPPSHIPHAALPSREELRARNEQAVRDKVQAAAAFNEACKEEENDRIKAKLKAAETLQPVLDKWAFNTDGTVKDCRTLLGTIQDVMWAGCTFKSTTVPELMMSEAKVKLAYRSCIIVFHPDRHQKADGDTVYRAERIFQHINEAWDIMRKKSSS